MSRKKHTSVTDDPSAFRHQVRLAAVQAVGLRPDELAAALAYEVEPLSGIPAAEAELAYTPVVDPDQTVRVYDVAVRRRKNRTDGGAGRFLLPLVVLGAVSVLLAGGDFVLASCRLRALRKDVSERSALQAQLDAVRNPAKAARSEARAVRERHAAAARAQESAATARAAYAEMLKSIASACGNRSVLAELDGNAFAIRLSGVAVTPEAAAETLVALTEAAAGQGWRLTPGPIAVRTPGLTAEFSCEVVHD